MKTLILLSALLAAPAMAQGYYCAGPSCPDIRPSKSDQAGGLPPWPFRQIEAPLITYRMRETCTTYVRVGGDIVQVDPKGFIHVPAALLVKASVEELEMLAKDAERMGEGE